MRNSLPAAILALGLLLVACARPVDPDPGSRAASALDPGVVLADFEQATAWVADSADNQAVVARDTRRVSQGEASLQIRFVDQGRDKATIRREVDWDLSGVAAMSIDVHNTQTQALRVALAFQTSGHRYVATRPQTVQSGWNHRVRFALDGDGLADEVDRAAWASERAAITRIMVLVFADGLTSGRVSIDDLRAWPAQTGIDRRPVVTGAVLEPFAGEVSAYETAETLVAVRVPPAAALDLSGFGADRAPSLRVRARLYGPDGDEQRLSGFFDGLDDVGRALYRLRWTPRVTGEWRWRIAVDAGARLHDLGGGRIQVTGGQPQGFIAVDEGDPRYFGAADGSWFYPIGENLAWAGDYEPWIRSVADSGGNWIRVWICPWNNDLDGGVDRLDLEAARAIDRLFDQAAAYGIQVQLVLQYHGMLSHDWHRSAYNQVNGGPCMQPEGFWVDAAARRRFKALLDYVIARWGASPHLFAWELFNEADLTRRLDDDDIIAWHGAMADYIREQDLHDHLITTSTSSPVRLRGLWNLAGIDFLQPHLYRDRPVELRAGAEAIAGSSRKPVFVAECSRDWRPFTDAQDVTGRYLHRVLWMNWMSPLAGSVMPWWWDTHVAPNGLERHWAVLAGVRARVDRRGLDLHYDERAIGTDDLRLRSVGDAQQFESLLYRPWNESRPPMPEPGPLTTRPQAVTIDGLVPGDWRLRIIDTWTGVELTAEDVTVESSRLTVEFPAAEHDLYLMLRRQTRLTPGVVTP